jgi:hypothetical protein
VKYSNSEELIIIFLLQDSSVMCEHKYSIIESRSAVTFSFMVIKARLIDKERIVDGGHGSSQISQLSQSEVYLRKSILAVSCLPQTQK